MSVNPKTLVEKFIKDSKGRSRLAAATSVLAVFTVLITVGVLTFPAISLSGSEEALQEQGIDITVGQEDESSQEVVAPPADEAPIVAYDEASQAPDAESNENVAEAITEDSTIGDAAVSEGEEAAADAPAEGDEAAEGEEATETEEGEEATEEELDPEKEEAEKEIEASKAAKNALAAADLSSARLIVGSPAADALAQDENVVASFDNIYLLQYANTEEAAKGFLRFYDHAEYVTPDVAVAIADDIIEDNSDPEEAVITTNNVYTEEENPFAELETAIVENEAEIKAEVKKTDALIALIDTGATLEGNVVETVSMLGEDAADDNGHGQRMVDYIVEENEAARILSIKALGSDGKGDVSAVVAAINYAVERGANIINLSASAYASEENAALADAVKTAESAGVVVVGAAGNNGFNAKYYIPGNIEEATIVGASDELGVRIVQSNFGATVDYNVAAGSTSEAAARMSGFVSAYGEAGIEEVLNTQLIFTTDFEGIEEDAGVGEANPMTAEDTDTQFTASDLIPYSESISLKYADSQKSISDVKRKWLKAQKHTSGTTVTVETWDALKDVIENQNGVSTVILDNKYGAFAAYDTVTIKDGKNITIKAGTADTIYHDSEPADSMTSFFKVENGGTLSLEGVKLTGIKAQTRFSNVGSVAIEYLSGNYEVKFKDTDNQDYWLDALDSIGSVKAVAPGTADGIPSQENGFTIRAKEKNANGNYEFLAASQGKPTKFEISENNLNITDSEAYKWRIITNESGSYLWNEPGRLAIAYDGYLQAKASMSDRFVVKTQTGSYVVDSIDHAYFVDVMSGGTLNVNNGTVLERADGGAAPIFAQGGKVNITGNVEICNNKARKTPAVQSKGWDNTSGSAWESWTNSIGSWRDGAVDAVRSEEWNTAGAILVAGGAELTLGSQNKNDGVVQIYSNHGQAGAIRVIGNSSVEQYSAVIGGDAKNKGNVGGEGGAVHISGSNSTYRMCSGQMSYNYSIATGGGIRVDDEAKFYMGYLAEDGVTAQNPYDAPIIQHNTAIAGDGGGIEVASNNVFLYNGEIAHNRSYKMGGGIYVVGDTPQNTKTLSFPQYNNDTNAYVYDNYAFGGGYWDGPWLNGDGGGIWFCDFGSYLYDERYLEVFRNIAGVKKDTRERMAATDGDRDDKQYLGNGDDFSKQGAKEIGEGIGADFVIKDDHVWTFDRPDKHNGPSDVVTKAIYDDGTRLDPTTVFPTPRDMNLKNSFNMDTSSLSAKNKLLIHDNNAPLGGGIGCNGVIVFGEVPMHYKKIEADLKLDKKWIEDGTEVNPEGKKLALSVEVINNKNETTTTYEVTLDGESKGTKLVSPSSPDMISWDGWAVNIDLPTYTFQIDKQLTDIGVSEFDRLNKSNHTVVDNAQKDITGDPDSPTNLNYGEPKGADKNFTVDGTTGQIDFTNWKIKVTETILDAHGNPAADSNSYVMSMSDLTWKQEDNPRDPSLPYYDKYEDVGSNFFVYTDLYTLSSSITNTTHGVTVNKTDEDGNALVGASFSLYKVDGTNETLIKTLPADGDAATSTFTFEHLAVGNYKVVEDSAPAGYTKFPSAVYFTIDATEGVNNWRTEYTSVDEEGQLYINGNKLYLDKLVWTDGQAVSDWTEANNITTSQSPYTLKVRGNGDVKVTSLSGNANTKYLITTNVNGIQRYMQDRKWHYGAGSADMTIPSVNPDVINPSEFGSFSYYYGLGAYLWHVENVDGDMVLRTHYDSYLVLNSDGVPFTTPDLNVVKEAVKDTNTSGIKFEQDTFTFTVPNVKKMGRASVLKVDESGNPLAGATLELLDSTGAPVQTQDESGNLEFNQDGSPKIEWESTLERKWFSLPVGSYTLREKNPPKNYITAASISFEVTNTGYAAITMTDKLSTPGETLFYKKEEGSDKAVVGAKLQLQYVEVEGQIEGAVHSEWTTTEAPHTITDLKPGVYKLVEVEAPLGYEVNKDGVVFTVPEYSTSSSSALPVSSGNDYKIQFTQESGSGALQTMQVQYGADSNVAYCIDYETQSYGATSAKRYDFTETGIQSANLGNGSNLAGNREEILKALWLGYPNDPLGLVDTMTGSELAIRQAEFRMVTQALIWTYTNPNTFTDNKIKTYLTASSARYDCYSKIKNYIDYGTLLEGYSDASLYEVPNNFAVGFYLQANHQPAIESYSYPKVISVTMTDEVKKGSLEVIKTWFESDEEQVVSGDDERLADASITIELWRAIQEAVAVDNGTSDDTVTEYVLGSHEKVEGPVTLTTSDNWNKLFENLPIVNSDGKPYYYYIVEQKPTYPFEQIAVGEPIVLQDTTEKNVISIEQGATIEEWKRVLSSTATANIFTAGETYAFTYAFADGRVAALTYGSSGAYFYDISGGDVNNISSQAQWIPESVPGKSGVFYLKNAANPSRYFVLDKKKSLTEYSYRISSTGTKAEMSLIKSTNGYYVLTCTNVPVAGQWFVAGGGSKFKTGSGGNGAPLDIYRKTSRTVSAVDQASIDVDANKDTWVQNKIKKFDFEFVKIDEDKLLAVSEAVNDLASAEDAETALQAIEDIVGEDKMLNGAIFELKSADGSSGDATTQTVEGINGRIQFSNVAPGEYVLTEKQPPKHYSAINGSKMWYVIMSDEGAVSIASQGSSNGEGTEFVTIGNHNIVVLANVLDTYTLPATGGVGTQVFAVLGGLLMLAAGALYVRRAGRANA